MADDTSRPTPDPTSDVSPRPAIDDLLNGGPCDAEVDGEIVELGAIGELAPHSPNPILGELGVVTTLATGERFGMENGSVDLGSAALGFTVGGVVLRGALPEMPTAGPQDAVDLVEPDLIVADARPNIAGVESLHPGLEWTPERLFEGEPMGHAAATESSRTQRC